MARRVGDPVEAVLPQTIMPFGASIGRRNFYRFEVPVPRRRQKITRDNVPEPRSQLDRN